MLLDMYRLGDGTIELHKHGCSHNPSSRKNVRYSKAEHDGIDWTSKEAFGADWWSDINEEEHDDDAQYTWQDDMTFAPCTKGLPNWEPTVTEATAPAKAKAAKKSRNPVRSTSQTANTKRRDARVLLFTAMCEAMEGVEDQEMLDLMEAQAARVAHMFGLDK